MAETFLIICLVHWFCHVHYTAVPAMCTTITALQGKIDCGITSGKRDCGAKLPRKLASIS